MAFLKNTLFLLLVLSVYGSMRAQNFSPQYLEQLNKTLPHKFKAINVGATLEAVRDQEVVKLYILIDDIEQYDQVLIERSDELGTNFSQCKLIIVERAKYSNNYVELIDKYPVSTKMATMYRIKTITPDGIIRMYPPVSVIRDQDGIVQKQ